MNKFPATCACQRIHAWMKNIISANNYKSNLEYKKLNLLLIKDPICLKLGDKKSH